MQDVIQDLCQSQKSGKIADCDPGAARENGEMRHWPLGKFANPRARHPEPLAPAAFESLEKN
jgi:hypothetical protein